MRNALPIRLLAAFTWAAPAAAYLQHSAADPRPHFVLHMVFLDRGGVIRADHPGGDTFFTNANIRTQLDKMLK